MARRQLPRASLPRWIARTFSAAVSPEIVITAAATQNVVTTKASYVILSIVTN